MEKEIKYKKPKYKVGDVVKFKRINTYKQVIAKIKYIECFSNNICYGFDLEDKEINSCSEFEIIKKI